MLVEGRKQVVQISHPTTNDPLWFEKITLLRNHAQLIITFSNFLSSLIFSILILRIYECVASEHYPLAADRSQLVACNMLIDVV